MEAGNAVLRVQLVYKNAIRGVFTTKWNWNRILEAEYRTETFTQLITLTLFDYIAADLPRRRWEDYTKTDLQHTCLDGVDCNFRPRDKHKWQTVVDTVMTHWVP